MKKSLERVLVLAMSTELAIFGISCGKNQSAGGPPYRAEVLTLAERHTGKAVDDPTQYELKTVTFRYLENLDNLSSRYFDFRSGGKLKITSSAFTEAPSVKFQEKDVSETALHYRMKDQVAIPQDNYSLFAVSTAYQLDHILSELETLSGIHPDEVMKSKGKFKVYFNTDLELPGATPVTTGNAAYIPLNYSFSVLRTSKNETIHLGSNLKVMAHEFGHLFFHFLTSDFGSNPAVDSIELQNTFRGFNEGFADLTSFTLTGSADIISDTFHKPDQVTQSKIADRNFSNAPFSENSMYQCTSSFYCYGILFDNAYYKTMIVLGMDPSHKEDRVKCFKWIVNSMRKVFEEIKTGHLKTSPYNFGLILTQLVQHIENPAFAKELLRQLKINFPQTLL